MLIDLEGLTIQKCMQLQNMIKAKVQTEKHLDPLRKDKEVIRGY
jgi:hypothetical protein